MRMVTTRPWLIAQRRESQLNLDDVNKKPRAVVGLLGSKAETMIARDAKTITHGVRIVISPARAKTAIACAGDHPLFYTQASDPLSK